MVHVLISRFLDSNGRKQQVTYEADARGYRVKTVAADTQSSGLQVPEIKTEIKSVRVVIRTNAQQELKDQKLEAPKGKIKQDSERGIDSEKPVAEIVPDRQKEPFPAPEELAKIRPEKPVAELVLDPQKEPFPVPEELAKILPEKPVATIVPDRQKEPFPVSEELAKILPESLPGLRPNEEAALVPNSNGQKPAPQGTIKFKDPRSAQLSDELGYFIGYPFTQGNYVYAL